MPGQCRPGLCLPRRPACSHAALGDCRPTTLEPHAGAADMSPACRAPRTCVAWVTLRAHQAADRGGLHSGGATRHTLQIADGAGCSWQRLPMSVQCRGRAGALTLTASLSDSSAATHCSSCSWWGPYSSSKRRMPSSCRVFTRVLLLPRCWCRLTRLQACFTPCWSTPRSHRASGCGASRQASRPALRHGDSHQKGR